MKIVSLDGFFFFILSSHIIPNLDGILELPDHYDGQHDDYK